MKYISCTSYGDATINVSLFSVYDAPPCDKIEPLQGTLRTLLAFVCVALRGLSPPTARVAAAEECTRGKAIGSEVTEVVRSASKPARSR